jgi:hypothetical protein
MVEDLAWREGRPDAENCGKEPWLPARQLEMEGGEKKLFDMKRGDKNI